MLKGVCHLPTNAHYIFHGVGSHCFHYGVEVTVRMSLFERNKSLVRTWNNYCFRLNPRPYRGGGLVQPTPWGFSRIAKRRRRYAPPGFELPYGANLPQFLVKKNWPDQVRPRSYDVIRGTISGNFSNKVVFSRNLTWAPLMQMIISELS